MLGRNPGECVGQPLAEFLRGEDSGNDAASAIAAAARGEACSCEAKLSRLDAADINVHLTAAPALDAEGRPVAIVHTVRNAALAHAFRQRDQYEKMKAIERFAGVVAHDINNHLTVIKGYCDLLSLDNALSEDVSEAVEQIARAYSHASDMTGQLLDFSGRHGCQQQEIDPGKVIEGMRTKLTALSRGMTVDIGINNGGTEIKADPDQLQQALLNMAINAREAMPDGGELKISVRNISAAAAAEFCEESNAGSGVLITVSDTGTGIAEDVREHIFEPYFGTRNKGKGTGLGLSMVYSFVTRNGGRIEVTSEPGRGTTFCIYFPHCGDVSQAPHADAPAEESAAVATSTVLVVEDDDAVRRLLLRVLRYKDYNVLEAANAEEARQAVADIDHPIDLLITDVIMPNMAGPELARHLRDKQPDLRVLYMSGYHHDVIRRHNIEADARFLPKPFSPQQLLQTVADALASREAEENVV